MSFEDSGVVGVERREGEGERGGQPLLRFPSYTHARICERFLSIYLISHQNRG